MNDIPLYILMVFIGVFFQCLLFSIWFFYIETIPVGDSTQCAQPNRIHI